MTNIIPVPECLKGTKITDFITLTLNQSSLMNTNLLMDCAMFLNQSFNTCMLENPFNEIYYNSKSQPDIDNDYQQAQQDILLKGWKKDNHFPVCDYVNKDFTMGFNSETNELFNYKGNGDGDFWKIETLNDFITLCALAGIDLGRWE